MRAVAQESWNIQIVGVHDTLKIILRLPTG
jgi:hypothetical protein